MMFMFGGMKEGQPDRMILDSHQDSLLACNCVRAMPIATVAALSRMPTAADRDSGWQFSLDEEEEALQRSLVFQ